MNRATKSGFAAEAQAKMNAKYSDQLAQEALEWVKEITGADFGTSGDQDNFYEVLKDGQILCTLANQLKAGSVKKIQTSKMAFKCMENINCFSEAAKGCGLPSEELFQTVDLWERQNLASVVNCLHALGRKATTMGKPGIGPKESEKNVRNFSDEQLKASESVIGLQMGTNKGASQKGMSFGNTRHM